jgi:hypothetical protein
VITLSANAERLVETLRELADGRDVDWSATWTQEDMADARRASCARFEQEDRSEP